MPAPLTASAYRASLAQRAARLFPSQACVAGFQLLATDRVALAAVSARSADATVRSKRARTVRFRCDGDALGVACTCWPTSVEVGACKHVWAALLALDRAGGMDSLRESHAPLRLAALAPLAPAATSADTPTQREPRPRDKGGARAKKKTAAKGRNNKKKRSS
jgi:hypothetical protein